MTGSSDSPLNRAAIRQLLTSVGSAHVQGQATPEATDYDWRDPHYFSADEFNRLAAVMSQVAARIAGTFTRFLSSEFNVLPTSITQHFGADLPNCLDTDGSYCLDFGPEGERACGFLAIPAESAQTWVTLLLGDAETQSDLDRPLSSLQHSLLSDLATATLAEFLSLLGPHCAFQSDGQVRKGQPDVRFDSSEEICKIVFQIGRVGKEDAWDVAFLLPCCRLAASVGKVITTSSTSPQELSTTLMEHLQQMPVTVTVRLASTAISFQETVGLDQGDILLLDKPIDQPVELLIDGQTVFHGRAARSQQQHAVLITASARDCANGPETGKKTGEAKKG